MAKFEELTKYIDILALNDYGDWVVDNEHKGTADDPIQLPFVVYTKEVDDFVMAVYSFGNSHPEYEHTKYGQTLEENDLAWDGHAMSSVDVSKLDAKVIVALLVASIRADRFCEGALLGFLNDGSIGRWLGRLQELDKEC